MDINFELYKVFYQVAKHLSFSEASKVLFISQSAVSQNVAALEKKLSTLLFIRSTKKVLLTQEGRMLLEHIEPAIHMIESGEQRLLETNNLAQGTLHIGASDTICKYYLIPYLKTFHEQYPNIRLQVTNRTSLACVDILRQGKVDLIVTNLPNDELDGYMHVQPIADFQDTFIAGTAFAKLKDRALDYKTLENFPILLLERQTTTSAFLIHQFEQAGCRLTPSIELGSIDLLVDLARIGLGIAFVPDYCLNDSDPDLFTLSLTEKLPKRQLAIVTNSRLPLPLAGQRFIESLSNDAL